MTTQPNIIDQAIDFVTELYRSTHNKEVVYYTLPNTLTFHSEAMEIAEQEELKNTLHLEIATLFFHTQFWNKKNPEVSRNTHLHEFIETHKAKLDEQNIITLMDSIHNNSEGKTLEESILYDAHYSYLGKKNFTRNLYLKAKDEENQPSVIELHQKKIRFMIDHNYRTSYAIREFAERKSKNIYKLQTITDKWISKKNKDKRKDRKLGRGIDTMYKSIYRNHINLSAIADGKANLIISVNTIILSVIITLAGTGYTFFETGFFKYARFTVPIIILLICSLTAVIFAILSARPNVTKKRVNRERLLAKKSSILFFGNFATVELQDFVREMGVFRQEQTRLYDSMSVDIYQLGIVLHRKYRLVQISYNVFMIGLAVSVLSFLGIFIYSEFQIQ